MAYIVGDGDKRKQAGLDVLGAPGSYENIKSQLQQQQIQQPVQSVHKAPVQEDTREKRRKYAFGGVVQHFQEGGFVDEEEDDGDYSLTGQSRTGGAGGNVGRGAGASPQQRSGSFTGLQKYIDANKPKIEDLSEEISGGIRSEADAIRGKSDAAHDSYLGEGGKYTGGGDFITKQIADAGKQEQSQEDAQRFSEYRDPKDSGPNLQESIYDARKLEQRSDKLATPGGRFAELQRIVGKDSPGYSSGERRLDQLLLAGDPQSRTKAIKESRQATSGLGSQIGDTYRDIGAQKTALQLQAEKGLTEAQAIEEAARLKRSERLSKLGETGYIQDQDLIALGFVDKEGNPDRSQVSNLYGVDPKFATGAISKERLARINALNKLRGDDPSIRKAYDTSEFTGDVATAKQNYEREFVEVPRAAADAGFWDAWIGSRSNGQETLNTLDTLYRGEPHWRYKDMNHFLENQKSSYRFRADNYIKNRKAAEQAVNEKYNQGENQGLNAPRTTGQTTVDNGNYEPGDPNYKFQVRS